ncbi:hypothetical protein FRC04_004867 [Tulasnella sp. 424]|nr:hypothetical protein FRC04_004867 [Tulasnella sp. 424]KAG8963545.1 hypothetical protein FRC05_004610 [Tulasnella sp. 425]
MEAQTGKKVKALRDDKGGEYMSKDLQSFLNKRGIVQEQTVVATPSQNGVAERLNRTLAEGIVAMLNQANLPKSFWNLALQYLTNVRNITPSSALSDTTSYEMRHGKKPDLMMYRTFGCWIFDGVKGWKFDEPSTKKAGITRDAIFDETSFPGLSTKQQTVTPDKSDIRTFWTSKEEDEEDDKIIPSIVTTQNPPPPPPAHNITFHQRKGKEQVPFPPLPPSPAKLTFAEKLKTAPTAGLSKATPPLPSSRPIQTAEKGVTDYYTGTRRGTQPAPRRIEVLDEGGEFQVVDRGGDKNRNSECPLPGEFPQDSEDEVDMDLALKATPITDSLKYIYGISNDFLSWREAYKIGLDIAVEKANSAAVRPEDSPRSWKEAMTREDADKWMEAAEKEVQALQQNGTWDLVELPKGRKAIGSQWVFLIKWKSDGSIKQYKGQLVAKGYAQAPGVDFDQVFAPTAHLAALQASNKSMPT